MEHSVYFWTALIGCSLLLIQVVLQVVGLGGEAELDAGGPDVDVDFDADSVDPAHGTSGNVFFGIMSFKAMVAFVGIFGLTGLSLADGDHSAFQRAALSALAGFVAMVVVGFLMRMLHSLGSSGSLVLRNALGHKARVYLRVPAKGEGRGKITIALQGRSVELAAITDGEAIGTGEMVTVVEVLSNETMKVVAT